MTHIDFISKFNLIIKGGIIEFENQEIYSYLNQEFENELLANHTFFVWQIKHKFGELRISSNSNKDQIWEKEIEKILTTI